MGKKCPCLTLGKASPWWVKPVGPLFGLLESKERQSDTRRRQGGKSLFWENPPAGAASPWGSDPANTQIPAEHLFQGVPPTCATKGFCAKFRKCPCRGNFDPPLTSWASCVLLQKRCSAFITSDKSPNCPAMDPCTDPSSQGLPGPQHGSLSREQHQVGRPGPGGRRDSAKPFQSSFSALAFSGKWGLGNLSQHSSFQRPSLL